MKPKLHSVPEVPTPAADIYEAWKADIAARDWSAVHVIADKRRPIDIPDYVRRWWR